MRKKKKVIRFVLFLILIVFTIYTLAPIVWVFSTSFKTKAEANRFPPTIIPEKPTLENYVFLMNNSQMVRSFFNSLIVVIPATILCVAVSALAAFAFSRYSFAGGKTLLVIIMGIFMIPVTMNVIPLYLIFQRMGLLNTYMGVIIAYQVLVIPLNIFILKNHFDTIPKTLEEAAVLDGCSTFQRLTKIIIPLSWPGLAISAIFTFRFAWNEFVLPLLLINEPDKMVFQVAIYNFLGLYRIDWGHLSASIVVGMLPIVVIIVFFQKQLIQGIQKGSLKG